MHRYEHSSRLGSSYAKLAPALRAVREQAERQSTQILTGQPFSVQGHDQGVGSIVLAEGKDSTWPIFLQAAGQSRARPTV
eukprot:7695219-Pyramimonas_sp.AAC.1